MAVQPFTLLGASVLADAQRLVAEATLPWQRGWGIEAAAWAVKAYRAWEFSDRKPRQGFAWRRNWRAGAAGFWLGWHGDFLEELQRAFFASDGGYAIHAGNRPQLAPAVAQEALEAMMAALVDRMLPSPAQALRDTGSEPPPAMLCRGSGCVLIELRLNKSACLCLLNESCVRSLMPPPATGLPARLPKISVANALDSVAAPLKVELGKVRIGLGALMSVKVGDVIRLESSIDTPLTVSLGEATAAFGAFLGQVEGTIAIEVCKR